MRRDKQGKLRRAVIGGIVLAVAAGGWYSVGLYRNKKAVESMIAERRRQEAQAQAERAEKTEEAREGRFLPDRKRALSPIREKPTAETLR